MPQGDSVPSPVVLVHGALCDAEIWSPQRRPLSEGGRPVVTTELDGYYPSAFVAAEFTADRHVRQVIATLEREGEPAHLIGHSRGARLALHVAADRPDLIRSLVLVEPGGLREDNFLDTPPPPAGADPIQQQALGLLTQGDATGAMRFYIEAGHGAGLWDELPELVRICAVRNADTLEGMGQDRTRPLSRTAAARVTAPTLLLEGEHSPAIFHRIFDVLETLIPDVRRHVLAGANHFLPVVDAATFTDEVLHFISAVEGR